MKYLTLKKTHLDDKLYTYSEIFPNKNKFYKFYIEFLSKDKRKHWFNGFINEDKNQYFNPPLFTPFNQKNL